MTFCDLCIVQATAGYIATLVLVVGLIEFGVQCIKLLSVPYFVMTLLCPSII